MKDFENNAKARFITGEPLSFGKPLLEA